MTKVVEKKIVYDSVTRGVTRLRVVEVPKFTPGSDAEIVSMITHCLGCGHKYYVLRDGLCWNCREIITSDDKEMLINTYLENFAKPWKDPQSLFCSPRLKEIIGKEPTKGKKCRGGI